MSKERIANKHQVSSLKRIINAFSYSIQGVVSCYKTEQAFRQELVLVVLLFPIPFLCNTTSSEKSIMIFALLFILIAELINSAIEALADQVSTDRHALIKKAKDVGSAVVLLSIVFAALIWLIVLV